MKLQQLVALIAGVLLLAACAQEPQQVEVTRLIEQEIPVTVEVTRIVKEPATVEVPVEVTRVVEVVVTATPEAVSEVETEPTPTGIPPTATLVDTQAGSTYTVVSGDTLSSIAVTTGTTVADISTANNLTSDAIIVGQELFIPGWDGGAAIVVDANTPPPATIGASQPPAQTSNLLPNPSFEGEWYFYLYNELQVPEGWELRTDEGPNTLEPGSGGLFNRPEVRVVPSKDLPPTEQSTFIFDGDKTVKAFKGGAPTSFSMFTDVPLQPGNYRFTIRFFPDTVIGYDNSVKTFATDPLSAEVRIIHDNGGMNWAPTQIGQRNTLTYDFTITESGPVRLGAGFRNRFVMANNGWFIDDWSLQQLP
ncbi:MAG: LysM peptidoglycan-binding domain-containing protein, partial [Chloroflexota bacterium]|jgi:LysM repeat protein